MKRIASLLLALPLAVMVLVAQTASTPEAQRILEDVRTLASPEYGGRAPGTDGIERAAAYIEAAFTKAGMQPVNGSMRQSFTTTTSVSLGKNNNVTFSVLVERPGVPLEMTKPTKTAWKLGVDYQPYGFSDSKTVTGDVVFAGYGLSSSHATYDDYKDVDVKGKVVIILRGLPKWAEKDEALKAVSSLRTKMTTARDKGAAAVCFVNQKGDSSDVLARFGIDRIGKNSGIVALQVRRTPCARIFPPKGTSMFVAEESIEKTKKPNSFALVNTSATVSTELTFVESTTSNILAMVPGTDATLKGEYIVVGAHYDHLGMGDENSLHGGHEQALHAGADDNASGTAGLMELARRIAASPLRRSVLFAAFTAEEKGLVGSKYFVDNPPVPLTSIAAMVNMDMIGRLRDDKLNVLGTGTSSMWEGLLKTIVEGTTIKISQSAQGTGSSDHQSFFLKDIPVLFFFTGLHSDYHKPSDTWEKVNYDGQATVVTIVERAVRGIGEANERPPFVKPAGSDQQSASGGFKVTFGIIPDYGDDPQGLRISGAKPGSPAAAAGLADGDIITKFGSTTVKNIYDLTAAMGQAKPGDVVEVTYLRKGKPTTAKVTLVGR